MFATVVLTIGAVILAGSILYALVSFVRAAACMFFSNNGGLSKAIFGFFTGVVGAIIGAFIIMVVAAFGSFDFFHTYILPLLKR